jgi:hypothetical protein
MTARIGNQIDFGVGTAIPLVIDDKPLVCESTPTLDRSMPADVARTKGQALIAAADEADRMTTDHNRP